MDIERAFIDTNIFEMTSNKLGEGTFGKVFIVKRIKDGKQFAAKIINNSGIFNGRDQMKFLRESIILHKLRHPAIVRFYGINFHSFDNPDKLEPTIITEYVPHGSLQKILIQDQKSIADGNWTPTKKYIVILGIADALRYLHQNGILHRDLKPDNILINENYYPQVCDFGLSRCFSQVLSNSIQLSMSGKCGTPLYMAPELLIDENLHAGAGVDVYAFSMIVYEIVSRRQPFSEGGKEIKIGDLIKKVTSGVRPKFPSEVTKKMRNLLNECWNQNAEERPSFDDIFEKLSSDFSSYFDEDVDEDEINEYLEILKEETKPPSLEIDKYKDQVTFLQEKYKKMKNKFSDEYYKLNDEKEETDAKLKKLSIKIKKEKEESDLNLKKLTTENAQIKKEKEESDLNLKKLTLGFRGLINSI